MAALVRQQSDVSGLASRVTLIRGDVRDTASYEHALDGVDVVVHAAAVVGSGDRELNFSTHVGGSEALVAAMKRRGVKRCVFVSTIAAGYPRRSDYAESKRQAERIHLLSGVPTTVLRYNLFIGPDSPQVRKIAGMLRGRVVPVIGSGRRLIQPIHVDDAIAVLLQAIDDAGTAQKTFTVSGRDAVTFDRLLDLVSEAAWGRTRAKVHLPVPLCRMLAFVAGKALKNPPITQGQITLIDQDAVSSVDDVKRSFAFEPRPLGAALG